MEYNFKNKNYKVSRFKTFLTNQLKKESIEIVSKYLNEFIENNNFELHDLFSILDRYLDYSTKLRENSEEKFIYINSKIENFPHINENENIFAIAKLYNQIKCDYSLNFIDENINKLKNNTKEKVQILLFKSDLLVSKNKFDKAFSVLRDCSNQSYDLYIFDSLELKRSIFEKMSIIGELENKSDVAINYFIYYTIFQASLEFLNFPYLDSYRNFRLKYSIIKNSENEIICLNKHLTNLNIDINLFNNFLQDIYKNDIPSAFKLTNIEIDTFNVSNSPIKELTYYSNYMINLSVSELVSEIELLGAKKIKTLAN